MSNTTAGIFIFISVLVVLAVSAFGVPVYRVWQQGMAGEANLRRAEQEKQIMIEQARAEKESAQLRADAIKIIGQAAKEFPEYRTQEFIGAFAEALQSDKIEQIIYVPTEANIPITEAGRVGIKSHLKE